MRRVNLRLLVALALLLFGAVAGTYLLHRFQVRRNAEDMARQARRRLDEGDDEEAIKLLARYVGLRPDDGPRQREYAELLLRQVESGRASPRTVASTLAALEVTVRRESDDDALREKLATLLARTGDADSARDHLAMIRDRRAAGVRDGDTVRVDLLYAAVAARTGNFDEAEAVLAALTGFDRRARRFDPAFEPDRDHPEAFPALAEIVEKHRRDPKTAETILARLVELAPDDVATWKIEIAWRLAHGQNEAAGKAVEEARRLAPDDPEVALFELRLAIVTGRFDRAAELLDGPLRDAPISEQIVGAKALLARKRGDLDAVIAIHREAIAAMPANPSFRTDLLLALAEGRKYDQLRPFVAESQPILGKDSWPILWGEAVLAMSETRWLEALQLWERVRPQVAADQAVTRRVDVAIANCHGALGQRDQANDARQRAFADAPESTVARFAEVIALEQGPRWREALEIAEDLASGMEEEKLAASPSLWNPLLRLRIRDQGARSEPRRDWDKVDALVDAIARGPDVDPLEVERIRIEVLAAKGRIGEALAASEILVGDHPDNPSLFAQSLLLLVVSGRVDEARDRLAAADASIRDAVEVLEAEARLAATAPAAEAGSWLDDLEARMGRVGGAAADRCARQLIAIHIGRGNVADAERIAKVVLARQPKDLSIRQVVLEIAAERDAADEVAREVAELVRIAGPTSATARLATAVSRIVAVRARRQGMDPEATATVSLTPEDTALLAEARGLLAQAGGERPRWSEVPRMLAAIAELQGDPSAAIGHLRKAVDLGETLPFARRRLAVLLAAAGRLDEAAPVIASLGDAGGPTIDRIRAQVLAAAGRTDIALQIGAALTPADCRDPRQLVWYARLLASCGRPEEAEAACRRATEAAPGDADAWLTLVRLQAATGGVDRAAETVGLALERLEGDDRTRFEAAAQDSIGTPDSIARAAREAVEKAPDDLVAARRLVEVLLRQNRGGEAAEELRRIIALESARGTPTIAWARRVLASRLAASARYADLQQGLEILAKNVDESGLQYPEDIALSISFLIGRNDPASWRRAQGLFDTLAKRRPLTVDERISLARIQSLVGNRTKARDDLTAIATSTETSTAVVGTIVELFINDRDFPQARAWLRRLQESSPDVLTTIRLETNLALAEGDRDGAASAVAKLFDDEPLTPQTAPRQLTAARVAADLGFPEAADRMLERFATVSPEGVALRATSLGRQRRTDEAIAMLGTIRGEVSPAMFLDSLSVILRHAETACAPEIDGVAAGWIEAIQRENPGSIEIAVQAAIAKESLGRTAEAEEDYRRLLATDGLGDVQAGIVAANLAWMLARPETAEEALELVERAIRELGPLPDVLDTRALIRMSKGQTILALEDINDAVLTPSALKLLHLAAIQTELSDVAAARSALARAEALGLGRERLTDDDAARRDRVKSFLAAADGES